MYNVIHRMVFPCLCLVLYETLHVTYHTIDINVFIFFVYLRFLFVHLFVLLFEIFGLMHNFRIYALIVGKRTYITWQEVKIWREIYSI